MKILLINPGSSGEDGKPVRLFRVFSPALALPHLARLIPARHQPRIVTDGVEGVDCNEPADAVVLTGMTCRAERAYQIADGFLDSSQLNQKGPAHA